MNNVKQRTFYVNEQKIQKRSKPQSYAGNFSGWYVYINNKKHFVNVLERRVAEDIAYARFVDSLPTPGAIENCTCKKNIICNSCSAAKQDYYRI